jgi:hypothetical protein
MIPSMRPQSWRRPRGEKCWLMRPTASSRCTLHHHTFEVKLLFHLISFAHNPNHQLLLKQHQKQNGRRRKQRHRQPCKFLKISDDAPVADSMQRRTADSCSIVLTIVFFFLVCLSRTDFQGRRFVPSQAPRRQHVRVGQVDDGRKW